MFPTLRMGDETQVDIESASPFLVLRSVAGAGKTSNIFRRIQEQPQVRGLYLAYNKSVVTTAQKRLKASGLENHEARTLHSLVFQAERARLSGVPSAKLLEKTSRGTVRSPFSTWNKGYLRNKVAEALQSQENCPCNLQHHIRILAASKDLKAYEVGALSLVTDFCALQVSWPEDSLQASSALQALGVVLG